jgi:alkylhydroperoxidase/carboxymuconolactone decarboxylase family protein YurZ
VDDYRCTLRKLAVRDDRLVETLLRSERNDPSFSGLDDRSHALAHIGSLIAFDATPAAYMCAVEAALLAGASYEQIVGVLVAVLPVVGVARVVSAAPNLGLALGYDVGDALELVERRV